MELTFFFNVFVFLFGLAVGSFLNSVIYRLQAGESLLKGRSRCPFCKRQLIWQDLIPALSFLFLGGKCRYCRQKISWQYPAVEISTALIFIQIFNFQFSRIDEVFKVIAEGEVLVSKQFLILNFLNLTYYWLISSFLLIIFVYDLKHYIIPDRIIYPAIAITFIYQLFGIWDFGFLSDFGFRASDFRNLLNPLLSAILASAFFLLIVLLSRGKWLGGGDVKLAFFMGLFLGFPNILAALFLAFASGAIIGIGLIAAGKKTLKSEVPFGPFLIAGTFIALFFGKQLISWYLNFL